MTTATNTTTIAAIGVADAVGLLNRRPGRLEGIQVCSVRGEVVVRGIGVGSRAMIIIGADSSIRSYITIFRASLREDWGPNVAAVFQYRVTCGLCTPDLGTGIMI